jgi:hypothetical protein
MKYISKLDWFAPFGTKTKSGGDRLSSEISFFFLINECRRARHVKDAENIWITANLLTGIYWQ